MVIFFKETKIGFGMKLYLFLEMISYYYWWKKIVIIIIIRYYNSNKIKKIL